MPSRCIAARWRSASVRFGPDHPEIATSTNNLAFSLSGRGPHRRCLAAAGKDARERPRAAARRAAGAVRRAAAAIAAGRTGARRGAQRDPARRAILRRIRREQARRAPRRRQRPPRRAGAPRSGSRSRSRSARQSDHRGGVEGARRSAMPPPSSAPRARIAAIATERATLAEDARRRIPRLRRAVESAAADGQGNPVAAVGRRGDGALRRRRQGKLRLRDHARGRRLEADSARRRCAVGRRSRLSAAVSISRKAQRCLRQIRAVRSRARQRALCDAARRRSRR